MTKVLSDKRRYKDIQKGLNNKEVTENRQKQLEKGRTLVKLYYAL